MSNTINEVGLKGKVIQVEEERSGETNGRKWSIHRVVLEGVPRADRKQDASGFAVFKTFKADRYKVGQVIGQVCRVVGFKFNKDGKVGYGSGLQPVDGEEGKPAVIEDAPAEGTTQAEGGNAKPYGW